MRLLADIVNRIVGVGDKRLFVVDNRDGFIMKYRQALETEYGNRCRIFGGTSLDLRIVRDYEMMLDRESRFIFVPSEDFTVLDDVAADSERVTINVQRFFARYHWNTIKNLSLAELEWLYEQKQLVSLNAIQTQNLVCEYQRSPDFKRNALKEIEQDWDRIVGKADFRKASEWMPSIARLMVSALALESWGRLGDRVQALNEQFRSFLQNNYEAIAHSGVSPKCPKIVTQIAPFIARQDPNGKYALIVVDGMNFWQSIILAHALEDSESKLSIKYDATLSWLPSVTELSRQAIFSGEIPSLSYVQSPHSEMKLWDTFWKAKHIPSPGIFYQHSGELTPKPNSVRIGYVNTDLDDMMHSAQNYKYLYDDTVRWVKDSSTVRDIQGLLADGFKVFITSDHGNVETTPYRAFTQADKAGSVSDRRYIMLSEHADAARFEQIYYGHAQKLFATERTYYAVDREIFSSQTDIVTHGGAHFLEVIIPFFTITTNP
ncbi:MAG: PglZ domain-containing protein [Clostridium sp.]|nr:PglZ domain-containing protein [Clostridium sp.]